MCIRDRWTTIRGATCICDAIFDLRIGALNVKTKLNNLQVDGNGKSKLTNVKNGNILAQMFEMCFPKFNSKYISLNFESKCSQ